MAAAIPNDDNIFALTYNICWGCMQDNTNDITGVHVVNKCLAKGKDTCLNNVIQVIDSLESQYGLQLDLVGTQESSAKYDKIHKLSRALRAMHRVHCIFGPAHHVSFYNPAKFNLDACTSFNISSINGKQENRPLIILLLTRILDGKKIAFINIHDGHGSLYKDPNLKKAINASLTQGQIFSMGTAPRILDNINTLQSVDISQVLTPDYEIIFMGDTNENINISTIGSGKYTKGNYKPFALSNVLPQVLQNKIIKTSNLPLTCCQISDVWAHPHMIGDYILYSDGITPIPILDNDVPKIAIQDFNNFPLSDHLPVVSILNLPLNAPITSKAAKILPKAPSSAPPRASKASRASGVLSSLIPSIVSGMQTMTLSSRLKYRVKQDTYIYLRNYIDKQAIQLKQGDILIIPDGTDIINVTDSKGQTKQLVIVQVIRDKETSIAGYVQPGYLDDKGDGTLRLKKPTTTLRILADANDPNTPKDPNFTGRTIKDTDILIYPAFNLTSGSSEVFVRKEDDPNVFGLIDTKMIEEIAQSGGNNRKLKIRKTHKKYYISRYSKNKNKNKNNMKSRKSK
jgi:hypothetical protein